MRAHFASDVPRSPDDSIKSPPPTPSSQCQQNWLNGGKIDENIWQSRVIAFKMNSGHMADVCEFIDDILQKAEIEALKQKQEQQYHHQQQQQQQMSQNADENKTKSQKPNLTDINGKMGNMARVFVVRVFDTICNCANNAATAPISRFKFRGFKRTSTTDSSGTGSGTGTGTATVCATDTATGNGFGATAATTDAVSGIQTSLVDASKTTETFSGGKSDFSFTNKLRKSLSGIKEKKSDKQKSKVNAKCNANVKEDGKQVDASMKSA